MITIALNPRYSLHRLHGGGGSSSSGGGGVPLDFRSDWAGQPVGQTTAAIEDNVAGIAKWTRLGNDSWKTVRDAGGSGLPATFSRYIEYRIFGTQSSENAVLGLTKPPVGGSRFWRMYLRWRFPLGLVLGTSAHHPIESYFGNCPFQWEYRVGVNQAGTGTIDLALEGCAGPNQTSQNAAYRWRSAGGVDQWQIGTWYRFEFAFLNRTVADAYHFQARIYDMSGVLLADPSNFRNVNGTLANTLANDNPTYNIAATPFPGDEVDCITRMQLGPNGPGGWDATTLAGNESYMDLTGVATSTQDWIGAHANGY